ncbi:MAG: deoxyribose-phosphate aldolase [Planctomycetota bacterium]|jgi:deoxyribose-phosphate aldolase
MDYTCLDIAKMIDHSLLRPELTEEKIIEGCQIAKKYNTATVCCPPSAVALVKKHLAGSDVRPATVVGFPHGYNKTETKVFEAEQAIKDGAVELDMVIDIGKLKSRDFEYVKNDIRAVVEVAHRNDVIVKVILENHYLTSELNQVKAAGGIRSLDMALKVRQIGATRFGATQTEAIMQECRKRAGES